MTKCHSEISAFHHAPGWLWEITRRYFSQTKLNEMLTEVQILDRAEGFADRFENRADGDKWLKRVTSYRLGAMWAKDQSEKELATLRAELDAKTAAFDGLKKLFGTEQDATTQHMENQALRAENERLRAALQALYDEQNGAPLSQREEDWFQAYRKAGDVLQKFSAAMEAAEIPA